MDYCSSCRRHLNGALVCPGCGAYAPDIAPRGTGGSVVAPGAAAWEATGADEGAGGDPSAGAEDIPPAPVWEGRAARRRQLARWKKNQRRAVVATAVALVGGGLTLASMDRHSADRAQAATAPDDTGMGGTADDPREPTSPSPTPTAGRPSHTAARTQTPTGGARQQQSAATPRAARPDAAAPPRPAVTSIPSPRTGTRSPDTAAQEGSGGTATGEPATSTPPAGQDSGSGTSSSSPSPASTSPTEVCLLVVCIG